MTGREYDLRFESLGDGPALLTVWFGPFDRWLVDAAADVRFQLDEPFTSPANRRSLGHLTGCTVLFVDHSGWPTEANRGVRSYGSVFKTAAIRYGIYLRREGSTLSFEASGNNLPRTKRTPLVWDAQALQLRVLDVDDARKAPPAEIAAWVRSRPGATATPKDIRDEFEIADSTLRERRDELAGLGVTYLGSGKTARYSAVSESPRDERIAGSRGVCHDTDPATPRTPERSAGLGMSADSPRDAPPRGRVPPDPDEHVRDRLDEDGGW